MPSWPAVACVIPERFTKSGMTRYREQNTEKSSTRSPEPGGRTGVGPRGRCQGQTADAQNDGLQTYGRSEWWAYDDAIRGHNPSSGVS